MKFMPMRSEAHFTGIAPEDGTGALRVLAVQQFLSFRVLAVQNGAVFALDLIWNLELVVWNSCHAFGMVFEI